MQVHQTPTLLLTRPHAASARFAEGIKGAEIVIAPLMEIVGTGAKVPTQGINGVVVTSRQALPYLPTGAPLPVFCVGQRTTQEAKAQGFQAKFCGQDAKVLVRTLSDRHPNGRLLHLHGTHTRGDIAARLTAQGVPTQGLVVYDQKACAPTPAFHEALTRPHLIVPLFSPRSALLFSAAAQALRSDTQLVALSPAVADALPQALRAQAQIASNPTGKDMRKCLAQMGLRLNSP